MSLLSKEQILSKDRKKTVDVNVKEWGGSVRLQELSASDRDMWENESFVSTPIARARGSIPSTPVRAW